MTSPNDTEQKMYVWLTKQISECQFQRIETSTGCGVPDVYMCMKGKSLWIELKIVRSGSVYLRKEQYAWGVRHAMNGGKCIVLARDGKLCYAWEFPFMGVEDVKNGKARLSIESARLIEDSVDLYIKRILGVCHG